MLFRSYCEVTDTYGNKAYVCFDVNIKNNFKVTASGAAAKTVTKGKNATLKVTVTATTKKGMTYEWFKFDEYKGFERIQGATKASYTLKKVTKAGRYLCVVTDTYGNTDRVEFTVTVKNGFTVKASGATEKTITKGKTATLKVTAKSTAKGLTYQWYRLLPEYGLYAIDGATKASYKTPKLSESTEFCCVVKDTYGNTDTVWFTVNIKNGFTAKASGSATKTVTKGKTTTLKVTVKATKKTDLTYQWFRRTLTPYGTYTWTEISGATKASYTTPTISEYTEFYCVVTDLYGTVKTVDFFVKVKSSFSAKLGSGYTQKKNQKDAFTGESVTMYTCTVKKNAAKTLSVVTKGSTEGVTYTWYKVTKDGETQVGTSKTLKLTKVTASTQYRVVVTDSLGNPTVYNIKVVVS